MPSAKKGRKADAKPHRVIEAGKPLIPRRMKNIEAGASVKAAVYRKCEPILDGMPPYEGEYTEAIGEAVANMIAEGAVLQDVASLDNTPRMGEMLRWIAQPDHHFAKLYAAAKLARVPALEELALEAALKPNITTLITKRQVLDREGNRVDVTEKREIDNVPRSELILKAVGWTLGHTVPKKHGRHSDSEGGKPNDQLKNLFNALMSGPASEDDEIA